MEFPLGLDTGVEFEEDEREREGEERWSPFVLREGTIFFLAKEGEEFDGGGTGREIFPEVIEFVVVLLVFWVEDEFTEEEEEDNS